MSAKHFQHNNINFEILEAHEHKPDDAYDYVQCSFYKKNMNKKLYIRSDLKLYVHKVMRWNDSFVSIKEIQRHPVNERLIHVDFYIIDNTSSNFRIRLPIRFENMDKSPGIKLGGYMNITSRDIEVKVKSASDLVPYLIGDLTGYVHEQSVKTSQLFINTPNITPIRHDLTVATLMASKGG